MTYLYEWFSLPNRVDIICPNCQGHAVFLTCEIIRIHKKADIPFFENSSDFEYKKVKDNWTGTSYHVAIFYPNLHRSNKPSDDELPEGYSQSGFYRSRSDKGSYVCHDCSVRKRHTLNWEKEAYYQTSIKGHQLWAFDREHLVDIKNFVKSETRREKDYSSAIYLWHLPTIFKLKNNRDLVVKQIDKLLMK